MDKRLARLIKTIRGGQNEPVMLDTYNQAIHEDVACTIRTNINTANHHFIMEKIDEPIIGALRGRNPENPNERGKYKQRLEINEKGTSNTITSVQKDNNVVVEPVVLGWTRDSRGKIVDRHPVEVANCVTAAKRDNTQNYVVEKYRIRKLTERECFRLMGVRDEDSDKIRAAVSKSQCYKLAGNSIVVDVMVRIFDQLLFGNKNKNQQLEIF